MRAADHTAVTVCRECGDCWPCIDAARVEFCTGTISDLVAFVTSLSDSGSDELLARDPDEPCRSHAGVDGLCFDHWRAKTGSTLGLAGLVD